jgi:phospho-N-acetylmuramoyl-pentapeptide-transferase
MLYRFVPTQYAGILAFCGILFAFGATVWAMGHLSRFLPKDVGREYAHDGKLSAGKPRGAGVLFVPVFAAAALLFAPLSGEMVIYLILLLISMMTGFLDDASRNPWGEYRKGVLDLVIAALVALTYLHYHTAVVEIAILDIRFSVPPMLYAVLIVVLVWTSVNVTNCADGVDGLSGTLTLVTIMTIYILNQVMEGGDALGAGSGRLSFLILLFAVSILGYLWYNAAPSRLMMGDAGSRAMGLFISIMVLQTGAPLLFIPAALVLLLDGGLGLVKVFLLRFLKIRILTKVRLPLHDHVRKKWGWSNTQTVFRFTIIQIIVSTAIIYGIWNGR